MSSYLTCENCGKSDETVDEIYCGFELDVNNDKVVEVICEACEYQHLMDI